jgi:hypothetical protein
MKFAVLVDIISTLASIYRAVSLLLGLQIFTYSFTDLIFTFCADTNLSSSLRLTFVVWYFARLDASDW